MDHRTFSFSSGNVSRLHSYTSNLAIAMNAGAAVRLYRGVPPTRMMSWAEVTGPPRRLAICVPSARWRLRDRTWPYTANWSPRNLGGARKYIRSPSPSPGSRSVSSMLRSASSQCRPLALALQEPRVECWGVPRSSRYPSTAAARPRHVLLYANQPSLPWAKSLYTSRLPRCSEQSGSIHPSRHTQLPSIWQSPFAHARHGMLQSYPVHPLSHLHVPSVRHVPWSKSHGRHSV